MKGKSAPALTPEGRENQLVNLAYEEAERQIRAGTASSQVISHFLKIGSARERMEREILANQKHLIVAKTEAIQATKVRDELYKEALSAMSRYSGTSSDPNV